MATRLVHTTTRPTILAALAVLGVALTASAQRRAGATSPTYVSVDMEVTVNRPAADVWARVGKYCDLAEWLRVSCTITAGRDGEVGAVRSVAGRVVEVLVGKTELSYTYAMAPREGRPFDLYHGTLEAQPVNATTSKLLYTLVFDNSMLADDAARAADISSRRARFTQALQHMKILAEGGTLPALPPGDAWEASPSSCWIP
ncbi:MAG: SRPBCC family protein [Acidobacteria bacterium]|nr:SRPBCC family protein [Acidobacteriota bacterium]